MAQLTFTERVVVVRLALDRWGRSVVAGALHSPFLRWRYGAPVADELRIVPQALRTADPSFAAEIALGQFGLAGRLADTRSGSPFQIAPPSRAWERELHGFGWLRHLGADATPDSRAHALALVEDWIAYTQSGSGVAWEPDVVARRLISWLSSGQLLLEDVDSLVYGRTMDSLAYQLIHLSAQWRAAPDGYPRLLALIGLVYGDLCLAGHQHRLRDSVRRLAGELARQVLPDGGHVSRHPGVTADLLLDLLPLRQCFIALALPVPRSIQVSISRMLEMLRFMRLGDSSLARFNGMAASPHDAVATVLAYDAETVERSANARSSRFLRLQRGETVVVMDAGGPPPLALAADAHAGCLSFELSCGPVVVLVNSGAPEPAFGERRAASRATAAHNTVCVDSMSSAHLVRHRLLERLIGAPPIKGPGDVRARTLRTEEADIVEAAHDGYLRPAGLIHFRRLELAASGHRLDGLDRLGPPHGSLRLHRDLPFAVHFHMHPSVAWSSSRAGEVVLELHSGEQWRFTARGAALSVEESVHFADSAGPRAAHQIVLRGATFGESEVGWTLERI